MASDVTKSLSWIKTVREKVEKTDATTKTPLQMSTSTPPTQTLTPGQTDPTDESTTVETDENTTGKKTHSTCQSKISGTEEVTTVTTSLRNGSEKLCPVFAVWVLFAAYLIIVHIVV